MPVLSEAPYDSDSSANCPDGYNLLILEEADWQLHTPRTHGLYEDLLDETAGMKHGCE